MKQEQSHAREISRDSWQMKNGDANGFELSDVENFVVVEIIDVAVGDEIKIGAANGAGGGKAGERRAIFEDGGAGDASAVFGKLEGGDARRADAVLNGDEAAVVPIEAVGAGEGAVRAGIDVDGSECLQVDAENAERVRDEKRVVVGREGDAVGIEKIAMDGEWRKFLRRRIEADDAIVDAVGEKDFAGLANDEVVEKMFAGIARRITAEKDAAGAEMNESGIAAVFGGIGPDGGIARIEADTEDGKKTITVCWNEIGNAAAWRDFNYFSLREAAEIENLAMGIPGETFGDEIFFFGE